jgi:hypothetical protein
MTGQGMKGQERAGQDPTGQAGEDTTGLGNVKTRKI